MAILASVDVGAAVNTEIYRVDKTRIIRNVTFCDRSDTNQNMTKLTQHNRIGKAEIPLVMLL